MAKAKAKVVRIDVSKVDGEVGKITRDRGLGLHASAQAAKLMEPYVPFRTGDLSKSSDISEPWRVTYPVEYARRVYEGRGMTFGKKHHPRARARWDEPLARRPASLAKQLTAYIDRM